MNTKVELLSPAGDLKCFYAAICAGADAVYGGLEKFGARCFAGNFSSDEFIEAIDYAHLFGKKLYLTLNILIKDREIKEVEEALEPLYKAGLDGVIVQDIGLISLLKKRFPEMEIHVSTQAFITGVYGARFFKELGVSRVVAARELNIEELRMLSEKSGVEVECFIHGAMCYSYSGMCLMSSFLGGRSGNRGRCAGPCRQPYKGKTEEDYLLSMKDLCSVELIPEIIDAGVRSLKIEGRMKSPEYVYGVTSFYRKYIDLFYEKGADGFSVSDNDLDRLTSIYSRSGRSTGYFHDRNGGKMITREKGSYSTDLSSGAMAEMDKMTLKVFVRAIFREGEQAEVEFISGDNRVKVTGAVIEAALNSPLRREDIEKQLKKTGNTAFDIVHMDIDMDDSIFMPVSALNELRRRGLDALKEDILSEYRRSL